ncbi:MAG: leucine-rich repeat domain-containing protein [bacterium]|nr:leucine-rich repeat domain-containing protein [bacterium]
MKKPKFTQVAAPAIVAFLISFIFLIEVRPGAISWNWNNVEQKDEEYDDEEYIDRSNYNDEQYMEVDHYEFYNADSYFTEERENNITELKLTDISNEEEEENFYENEEAPSPEKKISLDLSPLSNYPNVETLTILPVELSEDNYNEDEEEYIGTTYQYYALDANSLTKMTKLKELTIEFMEIDNLSFLASSNIEQVTFKNCSFRALTKSQYKEFKKLISIGIENTHEGLNIDEMLVCANNLKSLNLNGVKIDKRNLLKQLPHPERLESFSFNVQTKDQSLYEALLLPVSQLTSLSIQFDEEISDAEDAFYELRFLGGLKNLEYLWIQGNDRNNLSYEYEEDFVDHDYSYLARLTKLKSLTMKYMEISDISFVEQLTALEKLDISNNFIKDITPMEGLTCMNELDLSFNHITDIHALSNMKELTSLSIGNNNIASIEAVKNMPKLETFDASSGFYYKDNPLCDASNILNTYYGTSNSTTYDHTDYFILDGYNPKSMKDLRDYSKYVFEQEYSSGFFTTDSIMFNVNQEARFNYVTLHPYNSSTIWGRNKNAIEDISPLENATNLVFLDLSGNQIRDITSLQQLENLRFLSCMDNQIEDISILSPKNFPNLDNLYLSQNNFTDGSVFRYLNDYINELYLQYYMTPFYNKSYLGIVDQKEVQLHVKVMGFDISELLANIGTGMEE